MILAAASVHILVAGGFGLLLMWTEGMFGNQADSALATAMLVQSVYPWLISPVAIGTSSYCASKAYRKNSGMFISAIFAASANLVALGISTTMDLGIALKIIVGCSAFSVVCMMIGLWRTLRPAGPRRGQS